MRRGARVTRAAGASVVIGSVSSVVARNEVLELERLDVQVVDGNAESA